MTASTFTVTLSRVMISWLGTSRVKTRRSIFTIRSTMGRMMNRPGPLAPCKRPSRKMTPRSYSWTIFTARGKRGKRRMYPKTVRILATTLLSTTWPLAIVDSFLLAHYEPKAVHAGDHHSLAWLHPSFLHGGRPVFALQEHHPRRVEGEAGPGRAATEGGGPH